MSVASLDPTLLHKQELGIPLSHFEARAMVVDLNRFIKETDGDVTISVLLLASVGSLYYDDVWDLLIL